jgi:hypothetical protein
MKTYDSGRAFHELLALLGEADKTFLDGARAVLDDVSAVEGYRWLTEVLGVALDCYLWADPERPEFVELVSPTRKFGGDNADAFYYFAPLDPGRRYRIHGRRGDACYLSMCVYGGPTDGRWSNRIVSSINNRQMDIAADGSFTIDVGAEVKAGNSLKLDDGAVCVVTRDYLLDPVHGRKASWHIEAVEPAPPPPPLADGELALRLRRAANFVRDLLSICPIPAPGEANSLLEPYRVPEMTYGWAAPDAVYCMGRYELADDEVLLIEGRSPECVFWNLCLWNPFLQTYDYRYERVTINGGQVQYEADGSWKIAVASRDPGLPNWLSTAGHRRGVLWFRWFLADEVPARPVTTVAKIGSKFQVLGSKA